jgi:hypothetical protein
LVLSLKQRAPYDYRYLAWIRESNWAALYDDRSSLSCSDT